MTNNVTNLPGNITLQSIESEARAEVQKEIGTKAKARLLTKMREIALAEKALANMKQELEVIKADISAELGGK
jgi:hypothetical protein